MFASLASAQGAPNTVAEPELPWLDVVVKGATDVPDSIAVSVPYTLAADPFTQWQANDPLLSLSVDRSGLSPFVEVRAHGPDGVLTQRTPGLLRFSGSANGVWSASVENSGTPAFTVRGNALADLPWIELTGDLGDGVHRVRVDGATRITYDAAGDVKSFKVTNVLGRIASSTGGLVPEAASTLLDAVVGIKTSEDSAALTILGRSFALGAVHAQGDPFGDGWTFKDDAGETVLTFSVTRPTRASPWLEAHIAGSIMSDASALLAPAAESPRSLTVSAYFGQVPIPFALASWERADGVIAGAQLIDPARGVILLESTLRGDGTAAVDIPAALKGIDLGNAPDVIGLEVKQTDTGARFALKHRDLDALVITARFGQPAVIRVAAGPALANAAPALDGVPAPVIPTITLAVDEIMGTVTALIGDPAAPSEAIISSLDGAMIFAALDSAPSMLPTLPSPTPEEKLVLVGGMVGTILDAPLKITGDPLTPGGFALDIGGHARVRMEPKSLAGSPVGLATIAVMTKGIDGVADGTHTTADPIALAYDPNGNLAGVTIPGTPDPTRGVADPFGLFILGDGVTFKSPAGDVTIGDGVLVLDGAPHAKEVRARVVRDGATVASLRVDRTLTPPVATFTGAGQTVTAAGPVFMRGNVADPDALVILDPATGETLLAYKRSGDRATLSGAGHDEPVHVRIMTIEGDPLSARGATLTFRDTSGNRVESWRLDGAAVLEAAKPARGAVAPFLDGRADTATGEARLLYATGSGVTHGREALDGSSWFSPLRAITVALASDANAPADRVLLHYRANEAASTKDASVPFVSAKDGSASATLDPETLSRFPLRAKLNFIVAYERGLSPFAKLVSLEPAGATAYKLALDSIGPTVRISAPATVDDFRIPLALNGSDADSGLARYEIQSRPADGPWTGWFTDETTATFSGSRDAEFGFRARGVDRAGNTGAWSEEIRVVTLARSGPGAAGSTPATDDVNDPPRVRFTAPSLGEALTPSTRVAWTASDPDGTTPTVNLYVSRDAGGSWELLYAGTGASYDWDTRFEKPGSAMRLKIIASDGSLQDLDVLGGLSVPVPVTPPSGTKEPSTPPGEDPKLESRDGDETGGTDPGASAKGGSEGRRGFLGLPGFELGLALVGLVGVALLRRRRA